MNFNYDHERFVSKNRALASGYDVDRKDKKLAEKGFSEQERNEKASCYNCKTQKKCSLFLEKQRGSVSGVISYGGNEIFICDEYTPVPAKGTKVSDKKIKSLLKNFKKGRF